ncbi:protein of unknown function [Duganella sp. CF517]|uniref:3-keto-disaccharide hydrolase n=1 Tax=Duganella sp. CF517 TaxID=1881038 RepID=UPI0008CA4F34|nr:DUF1080 domain-containing protein [Duganella sp. CF517]SEN11385.1 protein of unknown function [Duganella sp. CF517]
MQITSVYASVVLACLQLSAASAAQPDPAATELWTPEPARVTPGDGAKPPSDAIVLFGGASLEEWMSTDAKPVAAKWPVADGAFKVRSGAGHIQTRRDFLDYQLHIEWRTPADVVGTGQSRGNSGVFLAATGPALRGYELQVLDCAANQTYVNGQAASIYKQLAPLVNACRPNGAWQSYDILWTAPRFLADGTLRSPARVTAFHNGVLVQWNAELTGETVYAGTPRYFPHGRSPIMLQDHGDKGPGVEFRNIWVRELE